MQFRSRHIAVIALSLTAFAACSSDLATPAAPPFSASESAPRAALIPAPKIKVKPLHHASKKDAAVSVTQTIGPLGGVILLPSAGGALLVPAGALSAPVAITMTALPGDVVSYEFAPHGLVFLKAATLAQKLEGTKEKGKGGVSTDPVELGYFSSTSQLSSTGAELEELRGGSEIAGVFTAPIWHFSGYALGCGRR